MMAPKQSSYPNLHIIKSLFMLIIKYLFFLRKISKNYSRGNFLKMLSFIIIHLNLDLWTHEIGGGNGIPINCKKQWINSCKLEKKSKEPMGFTNPNFWHLKVRSYSIQKICLWRSNQENTKRNEIERFKKLNSFLKMIN